MNVHRASAREGEILPPDRDKVYKEAQSALFTFYDARLPTGISDVIFIFSSWVHFLAEINDIPSFLMIDHHVPSRGARERDGQSVFNKFSSFRLFYFEDIAIICTFSFSIVLFQSN